MAGSMTMATSQIALGNQLADSDPPAQAIDSPVPIYSFILGYIPNANIISAQDSANGNWSYSYDEFNRLLTCPPQKLHQAFSNTEPSYFKLAGCRCRSVKKFILPVPIKNLVLTETIEFTGPSL
jgi:hypothetical protein